MKKLLLTTALVGVAFAATPAKAEVALGLGGHFKGYMTWNNQDDDDDGLPDAGGVTVGSEDSNAVDIVRDTEIHFTGETTLDNGLTVGFHAETEADGGDDMAVQESYAYFAGNWGRVNFGAEDGAAYLLQVAAPAADSNVDGIRQYVNPVNYDTLSDGQFDVSGNGAIAGATEVSTFDFANLDDQWDYAQDLNGYNDKMTYITPVFNGFQAAVSYTPDAGYAPSFGVGADNVENAYSDGWEVAGRYEGQFSSVRLTLGAGYTHLSLEQEDQSPAAGDFTDDMSAWNVGGNVGVGPFNVGAIWYKDNGGDQFVSATNNDSDNRVWVVGVDYTTGPFVLGASYFDRDEGQVEAGDSTDVDTRRYSGGVTYAYGPGMTFRGSVHHIKHELDGDAVVLTQPEQSVDATSVLLGTQINF